MGGGVGGWVEGCLAGGERDKSSNCCMGEEGGGRRGKGGVG